MRKEFVIPFLKNSDERETMISKFSKKEGKNENM